MRKSIVRIRGRGKGRRRAAKTSLAVAQELRGLDTRGAMIQTLIPLGPKAVNDVLQEEVTQLAGARYRREGGLPGYARWGGPPGSVYLADQKVGVRVPRVRDTVRDEEVPLTTQAGLQDAPRADDAALRKVLKGLSCRDYESCVDPVAQTFGLSASSLSRRFKRAGAKKLPERSERDLSPQDIIGRFLEGKTFGDDERVIALGVTLKGGKVVGGFVQTATENELVGTPFLRSLVERGLDASQGLLCVIDGSKGLRQAIDKVFAGKALVQRCPWHKRENVVRYLPAGRQAEFRRKLQNGYPPATYEKAQAALKKVRAELATIHQSAVSSLDEGFEETLTLHRLGVFEELGPSFKTTHCIENLHALVGRRTDKIDCRRNSEQKHRWLATTVLEIEPRLRKVRGHRHLPRLRAVLQSTRKIRRAEVA